MKKIRTVYKKEEGKIPVCLYCGKNLRRNTVSITSDSEIPPRKIWGKEVYEAKTMHHGSNDGTMYYHDLWLGERGYWHGLFCSSRCGYLYGVDRAREVLRIQARQYGRNTKD